jgi:hypothetical protein
LAACSGDDTDPPAVDAHVPVGDGGSVQSLEGCDDMTGPCRCPVFAHGGHTYVICSSQATWTEARAACRSAGMDLIEIGSAAEQKWIWETLVDRYGAMDAWTGLNDRDTEGTFVWSNGAPVTYTGWGGGQPDSGGPIDDADDEDCVELHSNDDGEWNDLRCATGYLGYVCESL